MALVSPAHHRISTAGYRCQVKTLSNLILSLFLSPFIFYWFSYPEVDPDLWGHLFFGREILEGGNLPSQNLYSYTAPEYPWINHEWLAEVVFYALFRFLGSPGLILLKVAVGGGIIWILDRCIRKKVPSLLVRTLTLVWIMAILSPGFNIRPQLFTYLFFAVFVFLFYRYDEGKKATLYWAPPLMALWVNLHGGFVAGLGAFGLFSFRTLWSGVRNRDMGPVVTQVFAPLIVSGIALLLNPYGLELLSFLAGDLLLKRSITEWQPIRILDLSFLELKLALIAVVLLALWKQAWHRWDFALALLAAFFALRYQRHAPLFAIAAARPLAEALQEIYWRIEKKSIKRVIAFGLLTVAMYPLYGIGNIHLLHGFRLVVDPREYPTQAADFLERNGVNGNLAVPFDWGEYLIWKLYPGVRVSIDGRYTTAYPMEVIQDSWQWMEGKKEWRRLLERYPTEIAMTKRYHPVTEHLRQDPAWVYIYSDPIAFIFVRKTPSQGQLLAKFREKRLIPPQTPTIYFPG